MSARQRIESKIKELYLELVEINYDKSITYTTGGWDVTVKFDEDEFVYGAHSVDELIHDLEEDWSIK